ncbi:30S ribosomal protein S3 [Nanoarchaeota archaeon]
MIERKFVAEKMKEFQIEEFISNSLRNVGLSHTKLQRTPLGEKIIIYASRPGLVVGRKGQSIKRITTELKKKFTLDNPQIEINEVENIHLDAKIVAEMISSSLERFGSARFKGIAHKVLSEIMNAGAWGVELLISGKIPSSRAKVWRFYQGYLKKSGDISTSGVNIAYTTAELKTGTVGIQVRIMPPETELPDRIKINEELTIIEESIEEAEEKSGKAKKKPSTRRKSTKSRQKPQTKKSAKEDSKEDSKAEEEIKEKEQEKEQQNKKVSDKDAEKDTEKQSEKSEQ